MKITCLPRFAKLLSTPLLLLVFASAGRLLQAQNAGALDPTFADAGLPADAYVQNILPTAGGQIYVTGANILLYTTGGKYSNFLRLNADGTVDTTFNPFGGGTFQAFPLSLVTQSTGKILIDSVFQVGDRASGSEVARFNTDGTYDPTFSSPSTFSEYQVKMLVQPDDKIILIGSVSSNNVNGSIARLNADGSVDPTLPIFPFTDYEGDTSFPQQDILQPDGKIIVAGRLYYLNGGNRNGVARLNADGTLDPTFDIGDSATPDSNRIISATALQSDGKILIGGSIDLPGESFGVARLTSTGQVDPTFNTGTGFASAGGYPAIDSLFVQADGKILVGGIFDHYNGVARNNLLRLNADGSLDTTFDPGAASSGGDEGGVILSFAPDTAGRLLVGGDFTTFSGAVHNGIVRLVGSSTSTALTATTFEVNGSSNPSTITPGAALTFTATQGAAVASGVYVRVQATSTPTVESSWTDLTDTTNGGAGFLMDEGNGNYTLTTNQYPPGSAIYFRVISAASGQTDSISNVVGPFDLTASTTVDLNIGQDVSSDIAPNGDIALIGGKITYTFYVRNYGPATASDVKVLNVLPSHLRFLSASSGAVTSGVPTDGVNGGGTVTWNLGTLAPNPTAPIVLRLVAAVTKDAPIGSMIVNNGYSIQSTGTAIVQGTDRNSTTVKAPINVEVTSNAAAIAPGGTLVYKFVVSNTTNKVNGVKINVPLPQQLLLLPDQTQFTDQAGQPLTPAKPPKVNPTVTIKSTDVLFDAPSLRPNEQAFFELSFSVPYDIDPALTIPLADASLQTETEVGGLSSFTVAFPQAALSGRPPKNPPHFALYKFVPDAINIFQLIAENATVAAYFEAAGIDTQDSILALGALVNPYIVDTTNDDGTYQEAVQAPGQPNGPAKTHITYALIFNNDGGFPANDVVLTDRIPHGTIFDKSSMYAPMYDGKPLAGSQITLDPDGRTLHFNLGTIKQTTHNPDGSVKHSSLGLVYYTVDVLAPGSGGASLGASIQAQGGTLATSSLLQTTYAQPGEIDTVVTAPGAAYLESYKGTAQAVVGKKIPYDIYYRNTGGLIADDFIIEDTVPAGTSFASANFLNENRGVISTPSGKSIEKPPVGGAGKVTFHCGKVTPGQDGFVRLVVKVEDSAVKVPGLLITNNPMVPARVFPSNPQRALTGPQTRATGSASGGEVLASSNNASRVVAAAGQAAIPHLDVSIMVPMSVTAGSTYDCFVCVANTTDALIAGTAVAVPVPAGANFISGVDSSGNFHGSLNNLNGTPVVIFPTFVNSGIYYFEDGVDPHSSLRFKLTFQAQNGVKDKQLITSVQTETSTYTPGSSGVVVAPVQSASVSTYVYDGAKETFADAASQIVTSALALQGSSAASLGTAALQQRIAQLTPTTYAHGLGGADCLVLNNNTVAIPLLSLPGEIGKVLVMGPAANLGLTSDVTPLISRDGNGMVAEGDGNLITAQNLIGQDGNTIVAQGGGNFQSLFAGIVAQGGGNIVAQGGGNIVAAGGGNLISQDGDGVISNDGGSLVSLSSGIVAAGGGNIVAAGGGNIVAAGGGNIVAQGGGNIVAQGGGNIVAQGGGNIVAQVGGNIVAAGGGNIVANGNSLLSPDASLAISLGGPGIVAAGGGNIVAQGGGN